MLKKLIQLGLTKNQAIVYLALIKEPEQSGGEIAKKTKIDRSFVYGILESLIEKGHVGYVIKENRKSFYATDPESLIKAIQEKESIAASLITELKAICPGEQTERSVKVYEGKAGLKIMAREVLTAGKFFILGGGVGFLTLETLKYEFPHYVKELQKSRIKGKILASGAETSLFNNMFTNCSVQIRKLKKPQTKASFVLFGNKLVIYSLQEKPIVVMIEDRNIVIAIKAYFDLLWEMAEVIS
jgi:sugar-specific transcriptional regulator TrmB